MSEPGLNESVMLALLAHGSRDPRWRVPFENFTERLAGELGEGRVALAYMEMATPTLMEIAERAVRENVRVLRILPLFMSAGAHVSTDIPAQSEAIRTRYPQLTVEILPPVGEHPEVVEAMARVARRTMDF